MRIAIVSPFPVSEVADLLGEESQTFISNFANDRGISIASYVRGLLDLGHEITVITSDLNLEVNLMVLSGNNLKIYIVPKREMTRARVLDLYRKERSAICELIDSLDLDIVHAHWTYEYAYAALQSKKPLLITAHDAPLTIFRYLHNIFWIFHVFLAFAVRVKAQDIAFVSPSLMNQWRTQMFWKGNSYITPNISKLLRTKAILKLDSERCLAISDVGSYKNIKKLLEAWPLVLDSNKNAHLELIGYGLGIDGELFEWARRKGFNQNINWNGFLPRAAINKYLLEADILITPSLSESFGLTAMEAMSAGIPVVGGINSGGIPYVVGNGGLLVDVRSSKEIAEAIVTLLNSPKLRLELGNNGIARVQEVFSSEVVSSQLVDIYKHIIRSYGEAQIKY